MNEQSTQWVIGAAAVLVVVLIGGWFITAKARGGYMHGDVVMATTTSTSTPVGMASTTESSAGNSIAVVGQPAGATVKVLSVTLAQKSWLAIKNSQGMILGAVLLQPGMHSYVPVPLLRSTVAQQTYTAVLYTADASKTFNLKALSIVKNTDGSDFGVTFQAQ